MLYLARELKRMLSVGMIKQFSEKEPPLNVATTGLVTAVGTNWSHIMADKRQARASVVTCS